jgi:sortase A
MLNLKLIINCLLITGMMVGGYNVFNFYRNEANEKNNVIQKTMQAEKLLLEMTANKTKDLPKVEVKSETQTPEPTLVTPEPVVKVAKYKTYIEQLNDGEIIGVVSIPKFGVKNAIVQGVELRDLAAGVGHYRETGMPGENRQIFLAGHNNRDFGVLPKLVNGDVINIQTTIGIYSYAVTGNKYVDKNDTSVLDYSQRENDELVLMTCFPFDSWGNAPQRFLIYATPIN